MRVLVIEDNPELSPTWTHTSSRLATCLTASATATPGQLLPRAVRTGPGR